MVPVTQPKQELKKLIIKMLEEGKTIQHIADTLNLPRPKVHGYIWYNPPQEEKRLE